ncbi:type IV pilus secretin PilQ [Alicycliphilus denitrificans]|uniref:Type IV pilus biogenesis and competence protein PilQ n=2 Tax=Alicycliphilus denitrificans TaxID=179636 RepID=F4G7R3_ALIDK|nr:type IV pilus secretin PilQ [Alicycliphilus denitrificans]ADU98609.1 type IV pilus secretin PilQ [Alicycliphilus denitrificans BC]AEB83216.1 type IV pilus secretin PilQ [Alicycliphilus denitrificans K601]QKD42985.1 type IV pilus secretin PilQ [Alicycliphilus denitrificans]GAO26655.1 type IV pilus secretin PilQ [Alicycliphilus sp. B1]
MMRQKTRLRRHLWAVGVAILTALGGTAAHAGGTIESVTGFLQGGAEVLRIEFSEPQTDLPTGFSIQSPARIALDFPGVGNTSGRSLVEINQGNVRSANIVQAGERSRVVLNLKQPTSYRAELHGKTVMVLLDPVTGGARVPSASPTAFAESQNTDVLALKDLDFRRGTDGAGRIVVGLPSSQVGVDLQLQGKGLVVDFLRSSLPEGLRRRLDVSDFGTPVQTITATQQGERVRLAIESVGEWEHSAYQSDNQFVVEIRPKKVDLSKLTQGPNYTGEKLSLNFQNIEVRSLLQVIADFTNFNIVTSDTVTGALTLRLKDVPWDQALQIIMDAKGLGMRKSGTVLWIAPKDEIDERTKKDYEAALAIQKLEPLRTQAYQLNYAKAADMVIQLTTSASSGGGSGSATRFLSERGSAIAEPRTNQLFVTDTPAKLEEVRKLLLTLDVPVRQVMIEARIVEARDTFGRSLGVRLGGGDLRANRGGDGGYSIGGGNRAAWGTNYSNATNSAGFGDAVNVGGNFVNLPASLSNVTGVGSFALSIFNSAANRFLTLELSAMEADGQGKVVSSPRLITADQTKALIEQGTEYPYSVTAPNGATTIAFKKAVLKLEVVPQITPEGNIILDLDVNKDSRGESTTQGVAIDTKHIKTQVLVENGGTVVIGGIFELEETNQENKIPLLGDVPVMGNLFKSRTKESSKREMLVFITPKVITDRGPVR